MSQTDSTTGSTPKTTKPPPSLFKTLDPAALNFRPSESPNNPPRDRLTTTMQVMSSCSRWSAPA